MSKDHTAPRFVTTNPATGQSGPAYDGHTMEQARDIVRATHAAFLAWRRTSFAERSALMRKVAAGLRTGAERFAELMADEMGKPVSDGRAEVEKCAVCCEFYADNAETFLARQPVEMGGPKAFVTFNPLGPVLAVMPWNFPFWQVLRFAAPTLMAGNTAVLKHASNVPGSALAIESLFRDAGFPPDAFRTVLVAGRDVAELIAMDEVAAVTLTGSVPAGRSVAAAAGAVLKKCVLELGGSDAYLVLDDADIATAARVCATGRLVNAGQSCIAAKRFIVHESIKLAFEQAVVAAMAAYTPADPRDPATRMGALSSIAARNEIHEQVLKSIDNGAKLLLGGVIPDKAGAWYPPTVLTDVKPGQPAHDDEIFGPVAAIITAADEEDAIRIANDSPFGLGSAVITTDLARGERIAADRLEAGMSFVNANCRSDPRLPFGGVKHSGYGREVSSYGILEFVNVKTVYIER